MPYKDPVVAAEFYKEWRNRPEVRERLNRYRREWHRKRRADDPDYVRRRNLKENYGLSLADYDRMVFAQGARCRVCGEEDILVVDHDHGCCPSKKTCGKCVRGLLCAHCNRLLGLMGDNVDEVVRRTSALLAYLDNPRA